MMASETCGQVVSGKRQRWCNLPSFAIAYATLLEQHGPIAVTEHTAEILSQVLKSKSPDIRSAGPSFEGVVRLAAAVAKRQIQRVLWFQDPEDLKVDHPENYALLRNCNLAGAHLHVNGSAHLWALYESEARNIPGHYYDTEPM